MADLTQLFERFHEIAENPAKQFHMYLEKKVPVVGVAPGYTPEEVIHSMGCLPFGVWGGDVPIEGAKAYFPAFIASILQSIVELGMRGTYKGMTALVVPSLSDSLKCVGQNWKYAVPDIPFIPASYPQNRAGKPGRGFTEACYREVAGELEKLTGAKFSEEKLAKSIEIYNEHNQLMREFSKVAAEHDLVTPRRRRDVFKSAWFMPKEEHSALMKELLAELKKLEPEKEKLRILTSGIHCDNNNLLAILEDNDMTIVGDDVLHESRQYRVDATEGATPMEKLVDKFARTDYCSLLYDVEKKRGPMLVEMAKERKAVGVVIFLTKFCDPEEFDYVPIKRALDAAGIPHLLIEIDRQMERFDQAQTALETFRDLLE